MPYAFEFEDGRVRAWHLTADGADPEVREDYRPSVFVAGPDDALADLRERLEVDPKVCETGYERRFRTLHDEHDGERARVLRADADRVDEVRTLAREIRGVYERGNGDAAAGDGDSDRPYAPGTFRPFDVDLAPGFRYCLDEGIDPTPEPPGRDLRTLEIGIDERALAEGDVSTLALDGERVTGEPADVLWSLGRRLDRADPDALVLSHGELVPLLSEAATTAGLDGFQLGRLPGWTTLAGESTYGSDGRVGHSPARYRVPGRAIVDRSNSFLWHRSGLEGLSYLVGRSRLPLQEAARASIGTVLTAIEIRVARERGVLAPWNKWEPEAFADVRTLHAADRGGFTFAPEVGFHEGVREIDFGSLYPRIIGRYNVSPETIDCGCEGGGRRDAGVDVSTDAVPDLGYEVCDDDGFLPAVLRPLLNDRARFKRRLATDPPEAEASRLRARSGAIKWVLVSCFGYQGYRNAKYGRIECHEAINAYAREILLRAKARLEAGGWRIVHGIVDSLWVTPAADRAGEPEPLEDVIGDVEREVGIPLERDGSYEWACFVPLRDASGGSGRGTGAGAGPAGALTRYFGKREDGSFKCRGIETRQRHTPPFVAARQREFLDVLDAERDPAAVCDLLERRLDELRRGAVDPADLVITRRVSKPLGAYERETRAVGALRRYDALGMARRPGQSVRYVVVDDDARRTRERVRLAAELDEGDATTTTTGYDADHYADLLCRACESVVSPLGWDRARIRRHLADGRTLRLSSFVE